MYPQSTSGEDNETFLSIKTDETKCVRRVAYLLQQTGETLPSDDDQLDREIDAGFEDEVIDDPAEMAETAMTSCAESELMPIADVDSDATESYDKLGTDSAMDEKVQ